MTSIIGAVEWCNCINVVLTLTKIATPRTVIAQVPAPSLLSSSSPAIRHPMYHENRTTTARVLHIDVTFQVHAFSPSCRKTTRSPSHRSHGTHNQPRTSFLPMKKPNFSPNPPRKKRTPTKPSHLGISLRQYKVTKKLLQSAPFTSSTMLPSCDPISRHVT